MWLPRFLDKFGAAAASVELKSRYHALYTSCYIIRPTVELTHTLFYKCSNLSNSSFFAVEFAITVTNLINICSKKQKQLRKYPRMFQAVLI